jgi:carbon monoxide dehydrogenase subunit G
MALKLENEFVVAAGIEPTWAILLDLSRVAHCLPGASVEPGESEGSYHGSMRLKLGPVTVDYKGTAQLEQVDEAGRVVVVAIEGKETRGQGSASATIRNHLIAEGDTTRVRVETELSVTGRPAQFGRGIMQDVSAQILSEFAARLSKLLSESGAPTADASAASRPDPVASPLETPTPESIEPASALDLTRAVRGALVGRVVKSLGIVAVAGFFVRLLRRHRRR